MKSEFEFITDLRSRYALTFVGDDCAVLPKDDRTDLLVTADMLVEDIDFKLEWTTPEFLGHKALAVSLSDVAAMGGTPDSALISLAVPEKLWKTGFPDGFFSGWQKLADEHGVTLVGGDISRSPDKLVIDSVVLGSVERGRAVLRSGAQAGDALFVTGFLGGAAAGLELLTTGRRLTGSSSVPERHLLLRHLQPVPQSKTAKLVQEYNLATAMIDLSDGLSSDLAHLCAASGVGARIRQASMPIDPAISGAPIAVTGLELALNGGEDFELLLTVRAERAAIALDLGFHCIGEITDRVGIVELVEDDAISRLGPGGYRHF